MSAPTSVSCNDQVMVAMRGAMERCGIPAAASAGLRWPWELSDVMLDIWATTEEGGNEHERRLELLRQLAGYAVFFQNDPPNEKDVAEIERIANLIR